MIMVRAPDVSVSDFGSELGADLGCQLPETGQERVQDLDWRPPGDACPHFERGLLKLVPRAAAASQAMGHSYRPGPATAPRRAALALRVAAVGGWPHRASRVAGTPEMPVTRAEEHVFVTGHQGGSGLPQMHVPPAMAPRCQVRSPPRKGGTSTVRIDPSSVPRTGGLRVGAPTSSQPSPPAQCAAAPSGPCRVRARRWRPGGRRSPGGGTHERHPRPGEEHLHRRQDARGRHCLRAVPARLLPCPQAVGHGRPLQGALVAALEFKSQVGSVGKNINNRFEEALGSPSRAA